jgi:acetyl esterase/lipase
MKRLAGAGPVDEYRAWFAELASEASGEAVEREDLVCRGVPSSWIRTADSEEGRIVLYFHSGDFVAGSVSSDMAIIASMSRSLSARVLAVDYRLAPEDPFPAGLDDCVSVYRWLLQQGANPRAVVIAGSSGGAGLALSMLLLLRERREAKPGAAVCLCPFADLTLQADSLLLNDGKDWMSKRRLEELVAVYLAGADPSQPLASPALADLSGLPPLFVQAGRNAILVDDARHLAAMASSDGVHVELDIWPEMMHMWQLFAGSLPEGGQAIEKMAKVVIPWIKAWA